MQTLKARLSYQNPITGNSVIWIRVATERGTKDFHLEFENNETRNRFAKQAKQGAVLEVAGAIDNSRQWYVTHFIVHSYGFKEE